MTHAAQLNPDSIEHSIAAWLRSYLAELLGLAAEEIDEETPFDRLGLDSLASVSMIGDLEAWLSFELDAAFPSDYPSIRALARGLAADAQVRAAFVRQFA